MIDFDDQNSLKNIRVSREDIKRPKMKALMAWWKYEMQGKPGNFIFISIKPG